ncbi:multidrug transporter [Aliivibrio sp. 1S165]|uniref:multidrug transporter n=1 Tax=unclassified Aliivibrio TaxID=2645654 RepID=UPI00080E0FDE|nr:MULTISPECIES: multidrug transporter [unclassified Aliivibrio]OCH12912.1 multidrug transporter [Aliivibrio sp. 1S165]OCH28399.1 multidrug transporter [Aliivibrio sp. 1S175]
MTMFKKTLLAATITGALVAPQMVLAEEAVSQEYVSETSEFFSESTISGNLNFWMRSRDRGNVDANGNDTKKTTNLDHGSIFANLGFNSGYVGGVAGADVVIYSTFDMWQNGGADHEMNFWGVNNPYDKAAEDSSCSNVWTDCNDNGASFATAAAKFKFGESVTAKLGYFQPSVPSSLGVNWSFAPGTYRGGEVGATFGDLALGVVVADEYKAPWFKETYEFRTSDGEDAGLVYSLGARYNLANNMSLDFGYGALTDGDRKNMHFKVKGTTEGGLFWSPQLYVVDDSEQFDSTAFQLAFLSAKTYGQYSFRAEATYTVAEDLDSNNVGNMSYRLTKEYGGSNGAYDVWWNNRSDFNHDGELAGFFSASRDFSDIGGKGFSAGLSAAAGAGSSAPGYDDLLEYSYSAFANYAIQSGALEGANVSFYYTEYFNDTDAPNWTGYTNLFQDETDFKLTLTIPFGIK